MKKLVLSVLALGVLSTPSFAAEPPAELVFATFSAPAPTTGPVTGTVSIVEEGIKIQIMDKPPLVIPFEAIPLLQKSLEEIKK